MRFIHFLFVLLVAGFAGAQLPDIPPCSLKCFIDALGNDGCTPLTNFKCHCKQPGLTAKITPCVNKACDKAEQSSVSNIVESQCSAAGVPISIPPVGGEATTTTAAAAPTETRSAAPTESFPKASPTETGGATAPKTESGAPSSPTETGASPTESASSSSSVAASPTGSSVPAIPSGSASGSGSGSGSGSASAPASPTETESHGKGIGATPSTSVPVIHNGVAGYKSSLVAVGVVAGAAVYVL